MSSGLGFAGAAGVLALDDALRLVVLRGRLMAEADDSGSMLALLGGTPDDARAIAKQLDIPFYDVHAEAIFKQRVVDTWVNGYAEATTHNPCFNCNRGIRFGFLMQRAVALGADYLATGHYARVDTDPVSGKRRLRRGLDSSTDQSYFLFSLTQDQLAGAMFPVGDMQGYLNLKGYGEFDAANRASGWNTWLTFSISPMAPMPTRLGWPRPGTRWVGATSSSTWQVRRAQGLPATGRRLSIWTSWPRSTRSRC